MVFAVLALSMPEHCCKAETPVVSVISHDHVQCEADKGYNKPLSFFVSQLPLKSLAFKCII